MNTSKICIALSLSLFFGWLLSLPFFGPILIKAADYQGLSGNYLSLIFIGFHTAAYLVFVLFLKKVDCWQQIMNWSLVITVAANAMLLFPFERAWPFFYAVMGVSSALFVLGWGVIVSFTGLDKEIIRIIALTIIGANIVLIMFELLVPVLSAKALLGLALLPLLGTAAVLFGMSNGSRRILLQPQLRRPIPKLLLLICWFFVFLIYLNGGYMYSVILPHLSVEAPFGAYYPFFVYILTAAIIIKLYKLIQKSHLIYLGVSLLGLAFVSFALLSGSFLGYILTIGLMESAFAVLDIFLWSTICSLTFFYGRPYLFFGIILSANTISVLTGNLISTHLLGTVENTNLVISLLAAANIMLAIIVVPRMLKMISNNISASLEIATADSSTVETENDPYTRLVQHLLPNTYLTERESQIVRLILEGKIQKDIADQLNIKESTVKTHIKSIYNKFSVSRKKELFFLAMKK